MSSLRTVGLFRATAVGVGAIVGGGILVLAGTACAYAGPAAMLAFLANGVIAFLTAVSFAEISSAFPESGGTYTFAKKVLNVRAAFAVGWIVWFAYIVAAVLYALGFAAFTVTIIDSLCSAAGYETPTWLLGRRFSMILAIGATLIYALSLVRKATGGGDWATYGKVVFFVIIVSAGVVVLVLQPGEKSKEALTPFFHGGASGLAMAMGFTFVALQGFDLIPAIAGEVKEPARTVPRAMFLSLGIALAIYIPLLLVVTVVGTPEGQTIASLGKADGEALIANAARQFMGETGYWLVLGAAILAMLSALQANLLAASRIAHSMAKDRALPHVLGKIHATRKTPMLAVYATTLAVIAIAFMLPDVGVAGAAAGLIFLIAFTLTHFTAYLARRRGGRTPFAAPLFPLVPVVGGLACGALALFQGVVVPGAGGIVLIWLALGILLYLSLFSSNAEVADAAAEGLDPSLLRFRGRQPLVLLPIANPKNARSLAEVANMLAPEGYARVMLLTVVPAPGDDRDPQLLDDHIQVVKEGVSLTLSQGAKPAALVTSAPDSAAEIVRVSKEYGCQSVLLGLGNDESEGAERFVDKVINQLDCDVAALRCPDGWSVANAERILVPVGGRGRADELRVRVLASIGRIGRRQITFATILPGRASDGEVGEAKLLLQRFARIRLRSHPNVVVIRSDDVEQELLDLASEHDFLLMGMNEGRFGKRTVKGLAQKIANRAGCAVMVVGTRAGANPSAVGAEIYNRLRGLGR